MAAQSTLKKPAAQQKAGMKRPAAHEKEEKPPKTHKKNGKDKEEEEEDDEIVEPLPLTEEALQSHNKFLSEMSKHKDMSQTQFDKTLATLPSRTAERLWKAFEACRKETGSDGQYKEASSGCGQQKKIKGVEEKWITKAEALQKWGAEELKDRLQKGTIKARRNPLVDHKKMAAIEAVAVDEVHSSDMEMGHGGESDEEDEDGLDPELKKMLNIKDAKHEKERKAPKENAWEAASKVGDEDGAVSIKSKVLKFKAELSKDAATVELKAHELKSQNPAEKTMVKDSLKAAEHGQRTCEKLDKMAKGKCVRSEAAKLLQVAYKALTDLKAAKLFKALKAE
ncbi:unnamed protein product [Cladocopium goreaui]|uniref:Uncharacterized protein n=1 Tax=Cladocopium goreaui TaxID=2562237 RepID=A0A9P1CP02_9DINO|nr:unnamed protein product [Cladocopium goreaui]